MISLLILVTIASIVFMVGYGISKSLFKRAGSENIVNSLFFGFVFMQGLYALLIMLFNTTIAYNAVISISILFGLITLFDIKFLFKNLSENSSFYLKHTIIIITCLFILAWPMFIYDNFDSYYHSGVLDLIEDVFGRSVAIINDNSILFSKKTGMLIQYTSSSLWMQIFNLFSINIVLIQYLLLTIMMYIGVYIFSTRVLKLNNILSTFISVVSIINVFYATSFINYHGGTMIILSLIFYLLYFIINRIMIKIDTKEIFILLIFIIFFIFTYRFAAPFFYLMGLVAMLLHKYILSLVEKIEISKIKLIFLFILMYMLLIYIFVLMVQYFNYSSYLFSDNIFTWDYPGYRQWELFRSSAVFMFFWGLTPSLVMGDTYLNFVETYYLWPLYYALVFLSFIITYMSLKGLYVLSKGNLYLKYNVVMLLLLMPVFFLLLDPYFTYKLFYITLPLFIIGLLYYIFNIELKYKRKIIIFFSIVFILNQVNLFLENKSIYDRKYNYSNNNASLLEINRSILEKSYFAIAKYEQKVMFLNYLHRENINIKTSIEDAKYIVYDKKDFDITNNIKRYNKKVFENKYFEVYEKKTYLYVANKFIQAEMDYNPFVGAIPIRMIHDSRINDDKRTTTVKASLPLIGHVGNENIEFIQIGIVPEYCVDYKEIKVNIINKGIISSKRVNGITFIWVPVEKGLIDIKIDIDINQKTRSLFPREQRDLFAKIINIDFVKNKYNKNALSYINATILNNENELLFSNGWYGIESKDFRWGSDNLELLVMNTTKNNLKVEFDVEPGPSLEKLPLKVDILDEFNRKIGYIEVQGRQKIILNIPVKNDKRYQILKLKVLNKSKMLDSDPRDLNLRIFSMKVVK